jgi:membrane-associated phospholipid phosphatase
MGGEVMMVLVFIFSFSVCKPSRSFYYLITIFLNVFTIIVLKLILHGPRPYMITDEGIHVNGFSSEFGDPSGHTLSSAQVLLTLYLDYVKTTTTTTKKKKTSYHIAFTVAYLTVVTIVGYSRMYNGVHSLDQVVYGAAIGMWIAWYCH